MTLVDKIRDKLKTNEAKAASAASSISNMEEAVILQRHRLSTLSAERAWLLEELTNAETGLK